MNEQRISQVYSTQGDDTQGWLHFSCLHVICVLLAMLLLCTVTDADAPTSTLLPPIDCSQTGGGQILMKVQLVGADGRVWDKSFILDTGCNASLVTDSLAQDLGLKPQPAIGQDSQAMRFNGNSLQAVTVPQLRIGAIQVSDVPFAIIDGKGLAGATGQATEGVIGQSVDGVIGNNILFAFPVLIDFQHNQVQFFRSSPVTPADLRSAGMDTAKPLCHWIRVTAATFTHAGPDWTQAGSQSRRTWRSISGQVRP